MTPCRCPAVPVQSADHARWRIELYRGNADIIDIGFIQSQRQGLILRHRWRQDQAKGFVLLDEGLNAGYMVGLSPITGM